MSLLSALLRATTAEAKTCGAQDLWGLPQEAEPPGADSDQQNACSQSHPLAEPRRPLHDEHMARQTDPSAEPWKPLHEKQMTSQSDP